MFFLIPTYSSKDKTTQLLNVIAAEKSHKHTSPRIYICNIKNKKNHIDFTCLNEIIYLDYCINHKKRNIKLFLNEKSIFYYDKYAQSKYYKTLLSIIAYYLPTFDLAINAYNEALINSNGIERINILNNKFAFLLKHFLTDEKRNKNILSELENTVRLLLENEIVDISKDKFLNANYFLYLSTITSENKFVICDSDLSDNSTWSLYKRLNSMIFNFKQEQNFNIKEYLSLEEQILKSNRMPIMNLYYFNLFLMSKIFRSKELEKKALRVLSRSDFKYSNIYEYFLKIKNLRNTSTAKNYVKFGYIFSRVFDINYLFEELTLLSK